MPAEVPTLNWISATLPKAGHRPEENEDAVAIAAAPARHRFALADGATEGWESARWAARLVAAFVRRSPTPSDFEEWLAAARQGWQPETGSGSVAWYAAEKQAQGSFATLVGLELRPARSQPGRWGWKAIAVGDSCLVHIRDGTIEVAFPHTAKGEFGDRPPLVPSSRTRACPTPAWLAGRAQPGDLLVLASDAAAAHLLDPSGFESAVSAAGASLRLDDRAPLLDWFRDVQTAVNDDVSVIVIHVPDAPEVA